MSADPKSVVIRYVEAARDGMSAVIRDSFSPDATWEYPGELPLSGTYVGVDEIVDSGGDGQDAHRGTPSPGWVAGTGTATAAKLRFAT